MHGFGNRALSKQSRPRVVSCLMASSRDAEDFVDTDQGEERKVTQTRG